MNTTTFILVIFLLLSLGSCSQTNDTSNETKTIELDEKSAQLVEADNAFGIDIFQKIREESEEENLMISPLSISLALAMTYNGADSDTKREMEEALKLNGLTKDQINSSYKSLIAALQSLDEDVIFEIANAIYYAKGFTVKQSFFDVNKTNYDAEIESININDKETALTTINSWVAEKTHDKITKILDDLSPDTRMVLLNAIYFFGTWTTEFDDDGTKMRNFTYADGSVDEVASMSKEDQLEYTQNEMFSAVKIPYGTGQYNMTVLLPSLGISSQELIQHLSVEKWKNWQNEFQLTDNVVVTMPRFKFGYEAGLNNVLKSMGMPKAFQPFVADFSGISEEDLYISEVVHKTYIDVNETGTEAAAVTAVVMVTTSIGPDVPPKTYFTVNRPFVFAITEKDTGAILFIGEVQKPEYEE